MLQERPVATPLSAELESALTISLPVLNNLAQIRHGFSTRRCGNLATRYGSPINVASARRLFATTLGIDSHSVAHYALTNSSRVGLISEADALPIDESPYRISIRGLVADAEPRDLHFTNAQGVSNQLGIDGLVTTTPGVALFMVVGDAAPVLLAAPGGRGIAMANVGIVGTVNHILEHTVQALCQAASCQPAELSAAIGPAVGPCCYALAQSSTWAQIVSQPFWAEFGPHGPGVMLRNNQYYFDLPAAISAILVKHGLKAPMIEAANLCTACPDSLFFPQRAGVAGRFGALLSIPSA